LYLWFFQLYYSLLQVALAESHDVIANADPQSLTTSLHALTDVVQILAQPVRFLVVWSLS
jgi:hypothetical protein